VRTGRVLAHGGEDVGRGAGVPQGDGAGTGCPVRRVGDRDGAEPDVAAGDVSQPGAQPHQLVLGEPRVGADRRERRVQEAHQRPWVEQHVPARRPVDHGREEPLLALHPAQVGTGVEVAGPHVGQTGLAVDVGDPGR
jgi:hypothetical protein